MLSILLPIYNFEVTGLVNALVDQCSELGIDYEVRGYDDGSTPDFKRLNREIANLPDVVYRELPVNLGRSAIRNLLAAEALYPYLLFMDCDSGIVSSRYIATYTGCLQSDTILYGGRVYSQKRPQEDNLLLHWRYGRDREQIPADRRARHPYRSFMTNNFLIPKAMFAQIRFDEDLSGYGHEDTLFGIELQKRGVPICHLDNPLQHLGLEPAVRLLAKSEEAVNNLYLLWRRGIDVESKLLHTALFWRRNGLSKGGLMLLEWLLPQFKRNLLSGKPNLRVYDLYRLVLLLRKLVQQG